MNCTGHKKRLLLLVEPSSSTNSDLCDWLTHKGLRTWWADDVSHAIEELSDFTVRNRPDVVMLEASHLYECLDGLSADLRSMGGGDISVVAMCKDSPSSRNAPFFATDYAQLETIIDRESGRPLSAAR